MIILLLVLAMSSQRDKGFVSGKRLVTSKGPYVLVSLLLSPSEI